MNERDIREHDVEREHLADVNQPAHWLYLLATLGLGLLGMVLLIGLLDRG